MARGVSLTVTIYVTAVCTCVYLFQVWNGQQLLQLEQELRHQLLQSLVIVRTIDCGKNVLQQQSDLWF